MKDTKTINGIIKISDPGLYPYTIGKDTSHGGYVVYQEVTTTNTKDKEGRTYIKTLSYPNSIQNALKVIIREKVKDGGKTEYTSLKEYVERWEAIYKDISKLVPNIE